MRIEVLVPRGWTHPEKQRLDAWYCRIGYQAASTASVEGAYPQLAPLLATPCDFTVYEKPLAAEPARRRPHDHAHAMTNQQTPRRNMTTTSTNQALACAWDAQLTFVQGPRAGEDEPVLLTFLPDGVIIHADRIPTDGGQLPRGIGEWTAAGDRFSYWFNVVLNHPSGRPHHVVYVHGEGTLAGDGQTFVASGGSEVYSATGEVGVTHRAELVATRAEAA